MEFQGRRGERAKAETRDGADPGGEKEGKYSPGFCFGRFAQAADLLSLKTRKSCGQVREKLE